MKVMLPLALLLLVASAWADLPDICAFPDTAAAQKAWQPQFGSPPVAVEKLPDGSTCLVLKGEYKAAGDRLCWDYVGPLDLAAVGAVSVEVSVEGAERAGTLGIYFGTPGGWYARIAGTPASTAWVRTTWELDDFGTEDAPTGWDKVERFRFSMWGSAAGPITFRLRGFKATARDVHRNYLRNGGFEVPGPLPYAWGSGHWGVGHLPWAADMDLWRRHFGLDKTVAHSGECSLRMVNGPDLPRLSAVSAWFGLRDKPASAYTLSAWVRADRDGLPVTLAAGNKSAKGTAGKEWGQVALNGVAPGPRVIVRIGADAEGTLWLDDVQLQATGQDSAEFHPHPGDEALCRREAAVDWSPPRRTADIAAGRRTTGPTKPGKVSIDEHGRFLLDGQPYLMHSLGLEFISDLKVLDAVAQAGFPDVCIQVRESITTAELQTYFDRCAALGLRLIPWLDGRIAIERFREHITTLRNHPALLCWYVFDEPSGERFAEADARLKLAHELDPNHPALINYLGNKLTGHMGDLYSTDIYPIPHGTPLAAINGVAAMATDARPVHKPVWMWLQGTGYAYSMDREPTPREASCMAYGSLIKGARGIYWFAQVPRSKECWDEMRALCVELAALAPALGSLETAPEVTCEAKSLLATAYRQNGATWVLAVNTAAEPVEARLVLAGRADRAEVVFEGRTVRLQGGDWTDRFGPYERHVYKLAR
jgi:hypothetical protein